MSRRSNWCDDVHSISHGWYARLPLTRLDDGGLTSSVCRTGAGVKDGRPIRSEVHCNHQDRVPSSVESMVLELALET